MSSVVASAPGKVNLLLKVGEPDGRGYHPLVSVFSSVALREYVRITPVSSREGSAFRRFGSDLASGPRLTVETTIWEDGKIDEASTAALRQMPDEQHLAVRAVAAVAPPGAYAKIEVVKTVPVAGGMAGGSADAAAALVAANELWDLGLTSTKLQSIGSTLGADVPACLVGGLSLGTGYGDQILGLDPAFAPSGLWVLAISRRGLSTPQVFREFDRLSAHPPPLPSPSAVIEMIEGGGLQSEGGYRGIENDLARPALSLRPELADLGAAAVAAGADRWMVSGSGPTLAALVRDEEAANSVQAAWQSWPGIRAVLAVQAQSFGAKLESHLPELAKK